MSSRPRSSHRRAQCPQERGRHDAHAAFALDRLDQDRAGAGVDRRLHRLDIEAIDLVEAIGLGAVAFEVFRLTAGGERRQRAAVKRAFKREDAIPLGMSEHVLALARHFDRRLVRFRPGISEEHQVGERRLREALGQPLALRILEQVGKVPEFVALPMQGRHEVRVGVAEGVDGDARPEIEIALAARRNEPTALPVVESDVGARVGRRDGGGHGCWLPCNCGIWARRRPAKTKTPPRGGRLFPQA